ncbi:MAG TPA: hypothetical protein VFN85_00945 [Solirubrobacterales bacterium]|nr:hypothetical protein [Solirubrobacterales bacterium]
MVALEALPFELGLPFVPPFFAPAFEAVLLEAFLVFDAAFLPLLFAFAFAFDADFAAFDDFDFEPAFDLPLLPLDLPAAFLSAI